MSTLYIENRLSTSGDHRPAVVNVEQDLLKGAFEHFI